ncbi:MAG TPA: hypothetical protein DD670_05905, partial [Planctomycetaceae bacterium]|nr:hypothetical protein [Planctomycetaceae bacterium]
MRCGRAILLTAILLSLVATRPAAFGQSPPALFSPPISATVLDPAGSPAAGAKVYVLGRRISARGDFDRDQEPVVLAEYTADEQGRAEIPEQEVRRDGDTQTYPFLFASDAKGRIGGCSSIGLSSRATQSARNVRIDLH